VERRINLTGPFVLASGTGMRATESSARWTGYFTPTDPGPHSFFVHDYRGEGGCRASLDDAVVIDNWEVSKAMLSEAAVNLAAGPHRVVLECFRRRMPGSTNVNVRLGIVPDSALVDPAVRALASRADVVLAAVGFDTQSEGESGDRTFALPVGQDLLIREIAAVNPKTIVAVTSGGGFDVEAWIDRVPALVATWFPGQEGGAALAQLLLGEANFSGRLPITFERRWADNPSHDFYYPARGTTKVRYGNGIFVGYRGFDENKTVPRFPFGHGLSYTRFAYSGLTVVPRSGSTQPSYDVAFEVKNTGAREGADVLQVYVAEKAPAVERPPKELKGFARVALRPGEARRVTVGLDARAFSYYDPARRSWRIHPGEFDILVGPSSAETPLRATVTIDSSFTRD
jgi:beta-glucosidase